MGIYSDYLNSCKSYNCRRKVSIKKTKELSKALESHQFIKNKDICIYLAGSLSRNEYGKKSDVDLFVISSEKLKKIDEYTIYAALIEVNNQLGYPEFSHDAKYLKVYSIADLINATGSPRDDTENLFTARQLLLLESRPVYNSTLFKTFLNKVLHYYFSDDDGNGNFKPVFLLNDILRYWRTLCLNYEQIRQDKTRFWRKKNINLKFSRKVTIFATLIPMVIKKKIDMSFISSLCNKTPLERFALGLDLLKNDSYLSDFREFIERYEFFIVAKEANDVDVDKKTKQKLDESAAWLTIFIDRILKDSNINHEIEMYLKQ